MSMHGTPEVRMRISWALYVYQHQSMSHQPDKGQALDQNLDKAAWYSRTELYEMITAGISLIDFIRSRTLYETEEVDFTENVLVPEV